MTEIDKRSAAILGCGYVGWAVGIALLRRGWQVRASTTTPPRLTDLKDAGFEARQVEGSDPAAVAALIADCSALYITLAAGRGGGAYRDVYLGTARTVASVLGNSPVRRVIYTSSTSVYAQDDGSWVDETSAAEPATDDGRVLVETEQALLTGLPANVDVSIVRLGGIYGPGRRLVDFAARFAGQERDDGDVYLNLAHRDDIVAGLVGLVDTRHHGVLNLSGDQPTTRRAVFDPLLRDRGMQPVRWVKRAGGGAGKRVRSDRIHQLLELRWVHPEYVGETAA